MNFNSLKKNKLLILAVLFLSVMTAYIFIRPEIFFELISSGSVIIREVFGNFYLWLGLGTVLFMFGIAFSPVGKIRLGGKKPEFKTISWVAMLYSAGMGAGILLRAVQEPVFMQRHPPIQNGTSENIRALEFTFYQWGFTAWAFYVFFALVMGYYLFVRKKTVLLSSTFHSKHRQNWIKGIDLLTVLTTVIGIVAAVGLGTQQIEGGIKYYFQLESGYYVAFLFTIVIFILAFISAFRGLNRGIKLLSNLNIGITFLLLIFVIFQSNLAEVFGSFSKAFYHYLIDFIPMSLALGKYNPGKEFLTDWTYYYWAFWLAWAPFTGIFIARISRGRTLRQMILGAIIIPAVGTFVWFAVFGQNAFDIIGNMTNYQDEFGNVFSSIFVFFSYYPWTGISVFVILILLIGFLVTSVDSAIFVLSMFTDHGKEEPKKLHRLIWAIVMLLMTESFLIIGQFTQADNVLEAMQKLLIITSLPFAFLTILIAVKLVRDFVKS